MPPGNQIADLLDIRVKFRALHPLSNTIPRTSHGQRESKEGEGGLLMEQVEERKPPFLLLYLNQINNEYFLEMRKQAEGTGGGKASP